MSAGTEVKDLKAFDSKAGYADSSHTLSPGDPSKRVFYSAVVVDFISNPVEDLERVPANEIAAGNTDVKLVDSLSKGLNKVENTARIKNIPRNAIIGWRIDERQAYSGKYEIFYPFFSPHLCLPVKSGEQVWVIYENVGNTKTLGYWISRKSCPEDIDDLNYSHLDRDTLNLRQNQSPESSPSKALEGKEVTDYDPLSFPQGGGRNDNDNTMPSIDGESAYTKIVESSNSFLTQFTAEPVPRFSKRSPDLTIQGSNNTLISLGEDRGVLGASAGESSVETDTESVGMGTIDIVAGRGSLLYDGTFIYDAVDGLTDKGQENRAASIDTDASPTAPSAVGKNSRDQGEVDKTPKVTNSNADGPNPMEGDPDFVNDLSRVYVSMMTNGDENFDLSYPNLNNSVSVDAVDSDAYVILKSNEIRVIARENETQGIDGSIKIIKEGTEDDNRAVIIMQPDGTVMIDSPKIIVGSGIQRANGAGDQVYLGRDASEPIVMGNILETRLMELADILLATTALKTPAGTSGNFSEANVMGVDIGGNWMTVTDLNGALQAWKDVLIKFKSKNGKTK